MCNKEGKSLKLQVTKREILPQTMSRLPGIGIFGTSSAAYLLIPVLKEKGFHVDAIWGWTNEEAQMAAGSLSIPFYTSKIDDLLLRKDVDLVIILCPPSLHSQIAVKALGIGKHVVCDKPGGLCQNESLRMVQAAQYYPSLLAVLAHGLRFLPNFMVMRRAIQDGYIGDVTLCDVRINCASLIDTAYSWSCDSTMGGGVLSLLGSHIIDLLSYLTGQRANRCHASLRTFTRTTDNIKGIRQITADDLAVIQLQMTGGAFATITINSQLAGFSQEVVVCGSNGHLAASGGDLKCRKKGSSKDEVLHIDVEDLNSDSGNRDTNQPPLLPRIYLKGLVRMVSHMKDAFNNGGFGVDQKDCGQQWGNDPASVAATFDQGLYVQAVVEALRRSNSSRQWTKVVILTEQGSDTSSITTDSWSATL